MNTQLIEQAIEALEALSEVGILEDGLLGDHGGIPQAQRKARATLAALRAARDVQPVELTDEEISRIAKTLPLEGCDQQKLGWGVGYSKESDFLEPNLPRAVVPFARAAIAADRAKQGEMK